MNNLYAISICISGEQVERFLNLCAYHNIKFYNIEKKNDIYYVNISALDFFKIKSFANKTSVKYRIINKNGLYFRIKQLMKSKVFFILPFICISILWFSSHFLWNVNLEGNISITQDMIKDYLHQKGIYYGMLLKDIPINQLKSDLRNDYPQINWVSVYLEGTTLQIALKENDNKIYTADKYASSENIVASTSGIVESILIRKGTAAVKVGDEVKKGDILIKGVIDIPAEDGSVKQSVLCQADGDVVLICHHSINNSIPLKYTEKEYTSHKLNKLEFQIHNKVYTIPNTNVPYLNYEVVTEKKEIPIFNIFSIPIIVNQNTYYEYFNIEHKYTAEESEKILNNQLEEICKTFMEKGVQIIEKNVKIETNSVYSTMSGNMTLKVHCFNKTISEDNP